MKPAYDHGRFAGDQIVLSAHDRHVALVVDRELAEYIANVMESEWLRRRDYGAKDIADGIREWTARLDRDAEFTADVTP